jgi:hypothetical protein
LFCKKYTTFFEFIHQNFHIYGSVDFSFVCYHNNKEFVFVRTNEYGCRKFLVILGDLVRSRFIKDRGELQSEILSSLKRINRDFKEDIWAPLKITRGDEISGVLLTVKNLIKILTPIVDSVAPNMMRFVVAKGPLSAGVSTRDASLIDGPAFHLAEREMERC